LTHDLHRLDRQHLIHAEVNFNDQARRTGIIITQAEGSTIFDSEGNSYLDAQAGLVLVNIGYGRSELADVAAAQMRRLMYYHNYFHFSNEPAVRLAAKLASMAPAGLTKVFFTLGGAESVESAVKLARLYQRAKGRPHGDKIICLELAYHGNTFGALSATGLSKHKELFGPLVPGFLHIPAPDLYDGLYRAEDPQAGARYAALLEQQILAEGPETVAAFLAEPILGVGGIIVPPTDYFTLVRAVCDKYGILLIADEVMTGFGRTGADWALQHVGVTPDLLCTAKGLTSGYQPLGAVLVAETVIAAIAAAELPFTHGFTYAGHLVACAVALASIEIYQNERLAERAEQTGKRIMAGLAALQNPHIGEIRGQGLLIGVEIVQDRDARSRRVGASFAIEAACFERGVIIGVAPYRETIMVTPPLVLTESEADRLVVTLDESIRAVFSADYETTFTP